MKIHKLTVGPIVGETTPDRVRIWGRGQVNVIDDQLRRCFGVIRYRPEKQKAWSAPKVFKMNPNFDMTGVVVITKLKPATRYVYNIGYFFSEGELTEATIDETDWPEAQKSSFMTASDNPNQPRTLIIGSCRYLLKTFLGSFFDDRGDKTFRSILEQIEKKNMEAHQLIMMGDQIYADDLNVFNPDKTTEQFYERYRCAFGQKHIRRLMSQIPTYMTLDDHEIEDNWPAKASEKDWKTLFPRAIHAYQTYQLSHSPNIPLVRGHLEGTPKHLWYKYHDGCCDVFITDSRTERFFAAGNDPEMLGSKQMSALKRWLKDGSGRVKIVVTSVPFFPDPVNGEGSDKWVGFPKQRNAILAYIDEHRIPKVLFFSGDIHASMTAELISPAGLKILSVISSPFFWPYPHPSARHFKRSGTIAVDGVGDFKVKNASRIIDDDNFTRIQVSPKKIVVDIYARKGAPKLHCEHDF